MSQGTLHLSTQRMRLLTTCGIDTEKVKWTGVDVFFSSAVGSETLCTRCKELYMRAMDRFTK